MYLMFEALVKRTGPSNRIPLTGSLRTWHQPVAGTSLWRLQIPHFSPWDANWPWGPPDGAVPPDEPADPQPDGGGGGGGGGMSLSP